ncbi:MAG TPA: cytochrome c [Pseudolabrys sp.]|nr:cytochrome c [Pseudolabrys sp.]
MNIFRYGALVAMAASAGFLGAAAYAAETSYAQLQRGKLLVDAGDCVSCHTSKNGTPFAGGRPIETPFGIIYSPNITPDRETGIGAWSETEFYNAMHFGISPKGNRLYPAFPYPYFTKIARQDISAIREYLDTLPPAKSPLAVSANNGHRMNGLIWPLSYRFFMRGWNWLFFDAGEFKPNPQKSAEWNHGAYLVQGAAHCGACHTPKNPLGGDETSQRLQGGAIQNWFAPQIAGDMRSGTGAWSVDDIVEYLKTGRNKYSGAAALMSEVVSNSTSKLPDADLHAIAVYIKDTPGAAVAAGSKPEQKIMAAGKAIFDDSCAACHQANGKGVPHMFPPLAHNANVQSSDPTTIIRVILEGAQTVPTSARPTASSMPAFNWKLSDDQIAAVANFVRNSWGNSAPAVSATQVADMRKQLQASIAQ